MRYTAREAETDETASLRRLLEPVLDGLGFRLVELTVSRHRGSVHIRAVIYRDGGSGAASPGIEDCSRAHRAIPPGLELAFPQQDISVEVSSPGIDRLVKDGAEFAFFMGRGVRCYRTDISDWTEGILEQADEKGIMLRTIEGVIRLDFDTIAKAKLAPLARDSIQEVYIGN